MQRLIRTLTLPALLTLAVACGSDDAFATSVPPTSTPFVPPPTSTVFADVSGGAAELLGFEEVRRFPDELRSDSPRLDREEAAEVYREFLSNTRAIGAVTVTDYCSDGTGQMLVAEEPDLEGARIHWEILPNPAGRWNEPRIVYSLDDPGLSAKYQGFIGGSLAVPLKPPAGDSDRWGRTGQTQAFENPTCGQ